MADIKFSCPHCNQHITCDELWGGHELQCPGCQGSFIVPGGSAPASAPAAAGVSPLVPRPTAGATRLTKAPTQSPSAPGASAPARNIPIRNLAPAVQKKQSPVVKLAITAAILVVLGAGGYFGYIWVSGMQAKAKGDDGNSVAGQVGHIAELNSVMDATEPGKAATDAAGRRRQRPNPSAQPAAATTDGASPAAAGPTDNQPVVPALWTLDLATAKVPDGRANGSISGTNFVAETARIDPVGSAQVLRLMQGPVVSPDREVLVYLHLKPGEKLGGQTLAISQDMRGIGVPQVTKRWKPNPRSAPVLKSFSTGYAMKLELGQLTNNAVSGQIYLAMPDTEQTVVAGTFNATVLVPGPNMQVMPAASPMTQNPSAASTAYQQRYGIRQ